MTTFQKKIQGILEGTYTIPQEDLNLEQRLWDHFYDEEKLELTEDELTKIEKYKEKNKN